MRQTQLLYLAGAARAASTAFLAGKRARRQATNVRSATRCLGQRGAGIIWGCRQGVRAFIVKNASLCETNRHCQKIPKSMKRHDRSYSSQFGLPFILLHDRLQEQRWQPPFSQKTRHQYNVSWGSLDACLGWEQGRHLLHGWCKPAPCLRCSPVSHPGIQAKSNKSVAAC